MTLLTYLFIIVFLVGLYFYAKCSDPNYTEALTNPSSNLSQRCPNLLIQKGQLCFDSCSVWSFVGRKSPKSSFTQMSCLQIDQKSSSILGVLL